MLSLAAVVAVHSHDDHGGRSLLVHASAGFIPGALEGRSADVVYLGVGALGKLGAEYQEAYWREVVAATGAKRVILIHWDDFWKSLSERWSCNRD